jgi:aspartyl-tRNA(Asn)/glutamyl-tRNA(Gln) amidotransferase subunit C
VLIQSGNAAHFIFLREPAMALDTKTVARVAHLARIALPEDRQDSLVSELDTIVAWVEQLSEVDTDGVEPMSSAAEMTALWREDKVTDGGYPEKIVANAPDPVGDFFSVPKVVE